MYAHRILLLTSKLTWRLEIDAQICVVALVILRGILYRVDMERYREPVGRQHNGLCFAIYEDLSTTLNDRQGE